MPLIVIVGHYLWMAVLYIAAGDLLPEQPAGCGKELRTCIHYRYRPDVLGGTACGRAPLREEVRASAQE